MLPLSLPWRLLGLVLLAGGLFVSGFGWGTKHANDARDAQQLQLERAATSKLVREVERGNVAQAQLGDALAAQQTSYSALERAFHDVRNHVPLVVRVPGRATGPGAVAAATPPGAPAAGPAGAAPGCVLVVPGPDELDLALSARAVWMWNSALAGSDQPAGACGLADPASPACAAATGLTDEDAWANHAENARLCAEDRTRHNHLIDFLTQGNLK